MALRKSGLALAVMLASPAAFSGDLQINGFINVSAGSVDNSKLDVDGYDTGVSFDSGTLVGLQLSKQVNDTTSATVQLIARGQDSYTTEASWAYVTFSPDESTDIRAGRLRTPFFYYSDFLEVGYAYNWVRPPSIVYRLNDMSSVTGVDFTRRFSAGPVDGSVQIYAGRYKDDFTLDGDTYEMELRKAGGAVFTMTTGDFGARASYHQADFYINNLDPTGDRALDSLMGLAAIYDAVNGTDISSEIEPDGETSKFYQASVNWDNGSTALIAEYTALRHDSALLNDDDAWLVSAVQRFSDVTVHLTYAYSEDKIKSGDIGNAQLFTEAKDSSVTLGVRYDYDSSSAFKFDAQYITSETASDRLATLDASNPATIPAAMAMPLAKETGMLYTVGMSIVF